MARPYAARRGRGIAAVIAWIGAAFLAHRLAVHLAQGILEQLEPLAVGAGEVQRRAAQVHRLDARICQLVPECSQRSSVTEIAMWCRPPSTSRYGPRSSPGSRRKQGGSRCRRRRRSASNLDSRGSRRARSAGTRGRLVELDRPLDVTREEREVVYAACRRGPPLLAVQEVSFTQPVPLLRAIDLCTVCRHRTSPCTCTSDSPGPGVILQLSLRLTPNPLPPASRWANEPTGAGFRRLQSIR